METPAVVIDASTLTQARVSLTTDGVHVGGQPVASGRGWIRRLAPEGWAESLSGSDLLAAERTAAISMLAALGRSDQIEWLTGLDAFGAAENKPLQYRLAARAGVPVPDWIVTTDPGMLPASDHWVSKPLGPGSFIDGDGSGWVVPTTEVDLSAHREALTRVPFILQRCLRARAHARVVTVASAGGVAVHSATLPASGLPVDWRMDEGAHSEFMARPAPTSVHDLAAKAAAALHVGYSAQDWVQDEDGAWWFVDLNPAGQWLFLPAEVADGITADIALFLDVWPSRRDREEQSWR